MVAHIPENGELRQYSTKLPKSSLVRSSLVKFNMLLESMDDAIVFFHGEEGFRLRRT